MGPAETVEFASGKKAAALAETTEDVVLTTGCATGATKVLVGATEELVLRAGQLVTEGLHCVKVTVLVRVVVEVVLPPVVSWAATRAKAVAIKMFESCILGEDVVS